MATPDGVVPIEVSIRECPIESPPEPSVDLDIPAKFVMEKGNDDCACAGSDCIKNDATANATTERMNLRE
jgi:hypothetical protein